MVSLPAVQRPRPSEAHAGSGEQGFLILSGPPHPKAWCPGLVWASSVMRTGVWDKASHMGHISSDKAGMQSSLNTCQHLN